LRKSFPAEIIYDVIELKKTAEVGNAIFEGNPDLNFYTLALQAYLPKIGEVAFA
jgi:hypothetical protein